ncbi:S8 family peptidase [Paenibacillus sp.]|uniref:S8 family peptidase n=1 Tax=Paenibacillus sp. TaxID=58172 RepID=UPI002D68108E|nr:S8 family peptidase [Paenibacillus sp.]HZG84864.1 S8 family peptidase [Paenibacillus sp.]
MADLPTLNHIEIVREPINRDLRGRQFPGAPRVQPRANRFQHSRSLSEQADAAFETINTNRRLLGITPDTLLILQFKILTVNQRETLIRAFNVSIVEETVISEGESDNFRLFIQFPTLESLDNFQREKQLYEMDSHQRGFLPYAQRRDLFDSIDLIRNVQPEDRKGKRLILYGPPLDESFVVDIDLWYDGTPRGATQTESLLRQSIGHIGGQLIQDLFRTPSLLLGKVRVNLEALELLLNLDIVALVDLPIKPSEEESFDIFSPPPENIEQANLPLDDDNVPLATVIDSGVFSGHPLLRNGIVLEEYDFGTGEGTDTDLNGHGTGVAGIVVYGDIPKCISNNAWVPRVRICSAKVMKNDPVWNTPVFPENRRPEMLMEEAIRYYHRERGCRIFNLSVGNTDQIYNDGRQFTWAETLDNLARELDIVIVVSAGNVINPELPTGNTRDEIAAKVRDNLFSSTHKLIDPGTASICLVVGAVARRNDVRTMGQLPRISVTPIQSPSAFTRAGFGVNRAVKPDLVAPGGSFVLQQAANDVRWIKNDPNIAEPSLRHSIEDGRWFAGFFGTSFSAPHITHLCALIENTLKEQLDRAPSSNLIRAMVVNSAKTPGDVENWIREAVDENDTRQQPRKSEYVLRLIGYGRPSEEILWSRKNSVTLFAEERLPLNSFHIYTIRIPPEFLRGRFNKSISISLAYDPPVRLSRKDYTANKLWFEVYKGLTAGQIEQFRRTRQNGDPDELPVVPENCKTKFLPGYQTVQNSTVQLRRWVKGRQGGLDLLGVPEGEEEPTITIVVAGKEQYPHPEGLDNQSYALVISFNADDEEIELYEQIQQRIRTRTRVRV